MTQSTHLVTHRFFSKNLLYSLILPWILMSCTSPTATEEKVSQTQLGDLVGYDLNGPVKSYRYIRFAVKEIEDTLIYEDTLSHWLVNFNKRGRTINTIFFSHEGDTTMLRTHSYEGDFLLETTIKRTLFNYVERTVYEQGPGNLVAGFKVYLDNPTLQVKNALKSSASNTHDDNGELVETTYFNSEGVLTKKETNHRLENGHQLNVETYFNKDGQPRERIERERDEKDQFLRYSQFDSANRKVDEDQYYWTNNGEWDYRISQNEDSWKKDAFTYDDQGNIIGMNTLDSLGVIQHEVTYEPKFDEYKNLVYELKRVNGVATSVLIKEIEYYEE